MIDRLEPVAKVLREKGVQEWDIYAQEFSACEAHLRNYDVEILRYPIGNFGYATRIVDRRSSNVGLGIFTGSSASKSDIERSVNSASKAAKVTNFPNYALSQPSSYQEVKMADPKIISDPEKLVESKVEEFLSLIKEEKQVTPSFGKFRTLLIKTAILSSTGIEAEKEETAFYTEVALKAQENGRVSEYWPITLKRRADEVQLAENVPRWVKLTRDGLRAVMPETKKTTIIFPPPVLEDIIPSVVGFHGSASSLYKHLSRFTVGERVADPSLTIWDNGLYDYGMGSSPFDDEGTPEKQTLLIEKGIVRSHLYDNMYAAVMQKQHTGNGLKGFPGMGMEQRYASSISTRPTNIVIEPGSFAEDELLEDVKEGLYVERFSWMLVDGLTSSFGSEIRNGFMIKDGELADPVKGGAVSGQVLDGQDAEKQPVKGLLSQVTGLGRDLEVVGGLVSPTMRFDGVQVAGK